ncbi:RNA recognition motif domain-containing protein [Legionella longbeachae]|uniref:Putative N-terminal part of eukaryotic RNA-binding protein n=1 Tax=Legionella longbeachae serogroup 1 (strain NSW150) TaxID=661367 RepID=D3HJG2_LEGLN|nr:RNA-binding protein [Legionella longbeachae]VEE03093.1 RNA binding protein, cold-inducible rrm [Legionella oakridgensis]HBD7399211.1 RNA-binding protein [Legionella pneumophila]ARB90687.1 RNA-binding protein [Legionella longbeachae]ARM32855.1 RNA-binding protein [Legionella longbeachae]EEZ94337.1 RNA binding protein [Legionella longbeachae D-4968]
MRQNKIYVGNLPFGITEAALQAEFSKYGKVEELLLIKDRFTGHVKGFGFITFSTQQEAESSLKMNGQLLVGRALKVTMAQVNYTSRVRHR